MKTIIAGSRKFFDLLSQDSSIDEKLKQQMGSLDFRPTAVLSGRAKGIDRWGEKWAKENNIPVLLYPANWNKYGRSAGPIRNSKMVKNADALVAFQLNQSRGTNDVIQKAAKAGLIVCVFEWNL
jgi:hypothetical protein